MLSLWVVTVPGGAERPGTRPAGRVPDPRRPLPGTGAAGMGCARRSRSRTRWCSCAQDPSAAWPMGSTRWSTRAWSTCAGRARCSGSPTRPVGTCARRSTSTGPPLPRPGAATPRACPPSCSPRPRSTSTTGGCCGPASAARTGSRSPNGCTCWSPGSSPSTSPPGVDSGRPGTALLRRRLVADTRERLAAAPWRTLADVAGELAVSPHHLSRVFSAATGVSLTRYRNRVRVRLVLERLAAGETSLAGLAADLGFADHAHLVRTVRTQTGSTPSEPRRVLGDPVPASTAGP